MLGLEVGEHFLGGPRAALPDRLLAVPDGGEEAGVGELFLRASGVPDCLPGLGRGLYEGDSREKPPVSVLTA